MHLECQNKYFSYGPRSQLIRALLYTYTNKIISDEISLSKSVVYCFSANVRTNIFSYGPRDCLELGKQEHIFAAFGAPYSSAILLLVDNINSTSLLEVQDNSSISGSAFKI